MLPWQLVGVLSAEAGGVQCGLPPRLLPLTLRNR